MLVCDIVKAWSKVLKTKGKVSKNNACFYGQDFWLQFSSVFSNFCRSRCPYVGCGYSVGCSVFAEECSSTFKVQDDTYQATAYVNNTEVLRILLDIDNGDWSRLSGQSDILAYKCAGREEVTLFTTYCDTIYAKYMRFECTVRPMKNDKGLKFICLDAIKL